MEVKTINKTSMNRYRFLQYFSIFLLFFSIQIGGQEIPIHLRKPTIDDDSKFTSTGNIGITISNFGTFGDGFVQQAPIDQPSCEYPKGSGIDIPSEFALRQNYPNPFNPTTVFNCDIPSESHVNLSIYDINGRVIRTLINKKQNSGYYSVQWNDSGIPSGLYFYQIMAGAFFDVKKFVIIK